MGKVRGEIKPVAFDQERSWIHSVSVVFPVLLMVRGAPVSPPAFYSENFQVNRKLEECLVNTRLPTTWVLQLMFYCACFVTYLTLVSLHLVFGSILGSVSKYVIDISTFQSYTLNVRVIKYSSVFAYGLLPGTFLKIGLPGVIIELLLFRRVGAGPGACTLKSLQVLLMVNQAWGLLSQGVLPVTSWLICT